MKIKKIIYHIGLKFKPLLKRILPSSLIEKLKSWVVSSNYIRRNSYSSYIKKNLSKKFKPGVNIIGYTRAEMGIGESCRIAAKIIETTKIPFGMINFEEGNPARMNDYSWSHKEITVPLHNTNLIVINADNLQLAYMRLNSKFFEGRYNIGYWAWELPDLPDEWCPAFNLVHEVWVPSNFVLDSVSRKSTVPIVRIPHAIRIDIPHNTSRHYFNLPDNQFLFLAMYDAHSVQARKNPQAVIEAFKEAFDRNNSTVGLVLKVSNAQTFPEEMERLIKKIEGYKNIYLIEQILNRNEVIALINSTDCFVSLHRSEGFGLVMAEAMYLGKPVIGTNWSGNIDFMNNMNSCPVNFKLVRVGQDFGPYKSYQFWANPDIEHAAYYMKLLASDAEYYNNVASRGQETILSDFSPEHVGNLVSDRLKRLELL